MGTEVDRESGQVFPRKEHLSSFLKENSRQRKRTNRGKGVLEGVLLCALSFVKLERNR